MLSDKDITTLINQKKICITPFFKKNITCASIDLSLGTTFIRYTNTIDTRSKFASYDLFKTNRLVLEPGQFVLGITFEKVKIPSGYYGFIETKGNFARAGISITCDDGHIDPGTNSKITLEIKNNNTVPVILYAKDLICQLFFFKLSSSSLQLYAGKYSPQDKPTVFRV